MEKIDICFPSALSTKIIQQFQLLLLICYDGILPDPFLP